MGGAWHRCAGRSVLAIGGGERTSVTSLTVTREASTFIVMDREKLQIPSMLRLRISDASKRLTGKGATGTFIMAALIPVLSVFLIYPVGLILAQSFNLAPDIYAGFEFGLENWRTAWDDPRILQSIFNSFFIWIATAVISFPIALGIAWALARVRMPFAYALEYWFWIAYMIPGASIAWILLLEPSFGFVNVFLREAPFIEPFLDDRGRGPLNVFSVPGIIWVNLMGNGIALKVMLFTPAFRNMDMAMEEAARVGGASNLRTMLKITVPLMSSIIVLVLALQLLRIFQSFETEYLLGRGINFWVYSTVIYDLLRSGVEDVPPNYARATVLASVTMIVIALIVPLQRWIVSRRRYTTISSGFRPGLIDFGRWKWAVFGFIVGVHLLLTFVQVGAFVLGSFMSRIGFFNVDPVFTFNNWLNLWSDHQFVSAVQTTVTLAFTAAILSPLLFSVLGYILVRTQWPGRFLLDWMIWASAAVPGMLSGFGLLILFLGTPGLAIVYGTIWALIIVVILQGNTTGVNLSKASIVQIGYDMEDAARVAGAGWVRTYFRIWLPLLMPLMVLLGVLNFSSAAGATSSIILLASRETMTLSILALIWASEELGRREFASVVILHISVLTLGVALIARRFGLRMGVRHM